VEAQADLTVDRHPWRAALIIGVATIALGMAYTIWFMPAITHIRGWWVVGDVWPPMLAARFVANGALGYMYEATPFFTAGPLVPILLAPVAAIGDAYQLTDNYRYLVPHPSLWLVYGPYAMAFGIVLLYAARSLGHRVWLKEGLSLREATPNSVWTQIAMAGLVLMPVAVVYGHFADVLALAFLLLGIRSTISSRFAQAALWFGLAIAAQPWAVLSLPVLIAAAPVGSRARTLVRSLLLPGVLVGYTLITDWTNASTALFRPRAFPQLGHAALWVSRSTQMIVGSPVRLGSLVATVALGWWLRGRTRPRLLLAGFALALLARPLFEPVVFAYDLAPALALLFLHERSAGATGLRSATGGGVVLFFFLLHPEPWLWWAVTGVALVVLASPALHDVVRRRDVDAEATEEPPLAASPAADLSHATT
jgi:hypothetical protein